MTRVSDDPKTSLSDPISREAYLSVGTTIGRPLHFLKMSIAREANPTFTVGVGASTTRERSALPIAPQALY